MAARPPDTPFDACMAEAVAQSRDWIPRWLTELHEALALGEDRAETLSEKQVFIQARTSLAGFRERLGTRFLDTLTRQIQGNADAAGTPARPGAAHSRPLQTMSLDDLTLMDDDRVQQTVDLARVRQAVKLAADEGSSNLVARLSRAQGFDVVRDQINPLRPEKVVESLLEAVDGLYLSPGVRALWLTTGATLLGEALRRNYQVLDGMLDAWGIEPAAYAVVPSPEPRPTGKPAPAATSAARAESAPATTLSAEGGPLTLAHLHQLLKGNLAQSGHGASDQGTSGSGNAMVKTLAAEVVSLMLRRVAEDRNLLTPVREQLASLKPGLLQLARKNPAFFASPGNPVRQLLDAIVERSQAFQTEQDTGFADFSDTVYTMVRAIQKPLADWLPEVPDWLDRIQMVPLAEVHAGGTQSARQSADQVERDQLADVVAMEIRRRGDYKRTPGVVRRFVCGPWAQVVAQARLGGAMAGSGTHRYEDILADLLWSCQLALASRNRPRLVKLVPHVLRTLRDGLDSIDYPRERAEAFFHALLGLQDAAYKTLLNEQTQGSRTDAPMEATESDFNLEADGETEEPTEFLDTVPQDDRSLTPLADASATAGLGLTVGAWVDLWHDEQPLRCRLSRASPHGTLFLFTTADGRSLSLTRRGVEHMQAHRLMRSVTTEKALQGGADEPSRLAWIDSIRTASA